MRPDLLVQAQEAAASGGLNLFGLVDASRFDACQPCEQRVGNRLPGCGTIVVLGTGGRAFWQQYAQSTGTLAAANHAAPANHANGSALGSAVGESVAHGSAGPASAPSPDAFAAAGVQAVAAVLATARVRCQAVVFPPSPRWNVGRLGECAGFGTVSPVSGLLLHPEFGPWLRVRGAVLVEGKPFGAIRDASISDRFQPCCSCERPCVTACPAGVHDGRGHQDLAACGSHRNGGGCEQICASRSACPLGAEHRDGVGEGSHRHGYQLAAMQRWFGIGVWRLVPTFLRQLR